MTPQETHAMIIGLLQQQGLPLTTDNLNRAMMAISQNDMKQEGATLPAYDAQLDKMLETPSRSGGVGAARSSQTKMPIPPPTQLEQVAPQAELYAAANQDAGMDWQSTSEAAPQAQSPTKRYGVKDFFNADGSLNPPSPDMPAVMFGTGPAIAARNALPMLLNALRNRNLPQLNSPGGQIAPQLSGPGPQMQLPAPPPITGPGTSIPMPRPAPPDVIALPDASGALKSTMKTRRRTPSTKKTDE